MRGTLERHFIPNQQASTLRSEKADPWVAVLDLSGGRDGGGGLYAGGTAEWAGTLQLYLVHKKPRPPRTLQ